MDQQHQQNNQSSGTGAGTASASSQQSSGQQQQQKNQTAAAAAAAAASAGSNNKKRNYKRDGIVFKDFSESDIDTLEEIAAIQNRSVEDIVIEVLQPQITSIVENFQQMKQDFLRKAATDSFKTIKK